MRLLDKFMKRNLSHDYCVVKLFKIIQQSDFINIKPCFDIMQNVFLSKEYNLRGIDVNYGAKKWKKVTSFYKYLETNDVVYFNADFKPNEYRPDEKFFSPADLDFTGINYSNHLQNLSGKTDEKDYIDFILVIPYEWYNLELIKSIIKETDKTIGLTYAYVCFLPKNYSSITESPLKVSSFSVSSSLTKKDTELRNNLKDIDCGFIPKIYPINFYNNRQLEFINSTNIKYSEAISDNLTVVTAYAET